MTRRLALTVLVASALASACGSRGTDRSERRATEGAAAPARPAGLAAGVRLVRPDRVRYAPRVVATGILKARQSSPLAVSVPGTLARVTVKRGQEVREGALLLALDDGNASAARRQAEAAVAGARAQLALADDALARMTRIRQEDGASEAQLFQTRTQRELSAAQLAAAEAQLDQAKVHLAHHFLQAPFPGVVTRIPDGVGIAVSPGTPLVTLVSTRQLLLDTSLTQEEAAEVRGGARVAVTVPGTGAQTTEATIAAIIPAVDPGTNRVPLEIAVPNPDGRFLPNAFARAELSRGAERDALGVPAASIVQLEGAYAVWVAGADGKARTLSVSLLAEEGDRVVIATPQGGWPDDLRVIQAPPVGIVQGAALAEAAR
jgi:RND family efflux transporter MFP subunit